MVSLFYYLLFVFFIPLPISTQLSGRILHKDGLERESMGVDWIEKHSRINMKCHEMLSLIYEENFISSHSSFFPNNFSFFLAGRGGACSIERGYPLKEDLCLNCPLGTFSVAVINSEGSEYSQELSTNDSNLMT